nr:hypothetical protein [Clostridium sp. USBA 49]
MSGLKNEVTGLKEDVLELKEGQERLEKKIDSIFEQTVDLTEFKTSVLVKLEDLKEVKEVTKTNCYEIAKLKAVK